MTAIVPIANFTTTATQNTVVFSSITQIYRDLRIVIRFSSSSNSAFNLGIQSGTTQFYRIRLMNRFGNSNPEQSWTSGALLFGHSSNQSGPMLYELNIFEYSQTNKNKPFTMVDGTAQAGPNLGAMSLQVGNWDSTAAISTLTIAANGGGTIPAGTSIAIYGVTA
jgi:hypothetical protein